MVVRFRFPEGRPGEFGENLENVIHSSRGGAQMQNLGALGALANDRQIDLIFSDI
jgi:hypothetical protein